MNAGRCFQPPRKGKCQVVWLWQWGLTVGWSAQCGLQSGGVVVMGKWCGCFSGRRLGL